MSQRNRVVATLSGVHLEAGIRELHLGKARVFWNPAALLQQPSEGFDMISPNNVVFWQDDAHLLPPASIAKLLLDVEFETKTGEVQRRRFDKELERAVLPLRLGTRARILVSPFSFGVDVETRTRDKILSQGTRLAAPEPTGKSTIVTLDQKSCESLQEFARIIDKANLDTFEVPIGVFSSSFYRTRAADRGIDLLVTLEALLSEGPESISMKVALRAACLLETEAQKRKEVFRVVKQAYRHRNTLVHGKKKERPRAEEWFTLENDSLEDIARGVLFIVVTLSSKRVQLTPEKVDDYLFDTGLLTATGVAAPSFEAVGRLIEYHLIHPVMFSSIGRGQWSLTDSP